MTFNSLDREFTNKHSLSGEISPNETVNVT